MRALIYTGLQRIHTDRLTQTTVRTYQVNTRGMQGRDGLGCERVCQRWNWGKLGPPSRRENEASYARGSWPVIILTHANSTTMEGSRAPPCSLLWVNVADNSPSPQTVAFHSLKTYCVKVKGLIRGNPNANEFSFSRHQVCLRLDNRAVNILIRFN